VVVVLARVGRIECGRGRLSSGPRALAAGVFPLWLLAIRLSASLRARWGNRTFAGWVADAHRWLPDCELDRWGVLAWCSFAALRARWKCRLGLSATVLLAPALLAGLSCGNLSVFAAGAWAASALLWPQAPIAAGVILGVALALKPTMWVGALLLLAHRPACPSRRHLVTSVLAFCLAALLQAPAWHLLPAFARHLGAFSLLELSASSNLSLLRLAPQFPGMTIAWSLGIGVVCLIAARSVPLNPVQLLCLGGTLSLAALPIVWGHSFCLPVPAATTAFVIEIQHRDTKRRGMAPLVGICCLIALLAPSYALSIGPSRWYALTLLIPWASLLFLTSRVLRRRGPHSTV
jgi:hypothetical protein